MNINDFQHGNSVLVQRLVSDQKIFFAFLLTRRFFFSEVRLMLVSTLPPLISQ